MEKEVYEGSLVFNAPLASLEELSSFLKYMLILLLGYVIDKESLAYKFNIFMRFQLKAFYLK